MSHWDRKTSIFWLGMGVFIAFKAYKLGIGAPSDPGPGFIFFGSGILLCILSVIVFFTAPARATASQAPFMDVHWKNPVLILAALVLFAYFFNDLGFLSGCFLFLIFIFRMIARRGWVPSCFYALLISSGSYFVFAVLLKCSLPGGLLRF